MQLCVPSSKIIQEKWNLQNSHLVEYEFETRAGERRARDLRKAEVSKLVSDQIMEQWGADVLQPYLSLDLTELTKVERMNVVMNLLQPLMATGFIGSCPGPGERALVHGNDAVGWSTTIKMSGSPWEKTTHYVIKWVVSTYDTPTPRRPCEYLSQAEYDERIKALGYQEHAGKGHERTSKPPWKPFVASHRYAATMEAAAGVRVPDEASSPSGPAAANGDDK